MALSDYDLLAFDAAGKPCTGLFKGNDDVTFEVRKTYLNAWIGEYDSAKGARLSVDHGDLSFLGNSIHVKRATSRPAILVYITADTYSEDPAVKPTFRQFAAIGAYGYDHSHEEDACLLECQLDPDTWALDGSGSQHFNGKSCPILWFKRRSGRGKTVKRIITKPSRALRRALSPRYTGVTATLRRELFAFIREHINEEYDKERAKWFATIQKAKALRYNAGDAYFAANGVGKLGGTEIGKSTTPVAMQMLGK